MKQLSIKNLFTVSLMLGLFLIYKTNGQKNKANKPDSVIQFPNILNYKTIVCDFHQHTVFSDGEVWPNIRVLEAQKDGLDAISMTDHIEYLPHKKDVLFVDKNRSYEIAKKASKNTDVIVVRGAEITKRLPFGHANAIFLKDGNKLVNDDITAVLEEVKKQDAFVFWNHPSWVIHKKDGVAKLREIHLELLEKGLLNGIEIVNNTTYSEGAFQMAIDHNLTIIGASDIHSLVDWKYNINEGEHRPVTLVFAKEKTEESIKQALFDRRTAVWFKNTLIGDVTYIVPLIKESLKIVNIENYRKSHLVLSISIENKSDVNYILKNKSEFNLHSHADILTINAHMTTIIQVKTLKQLTEFDLKFKVLNTLIAPKKHPSVTFKIKVENKK
ncbi:Sb-PDE family phosphodiesterase [uncultured Polaribacter sp.]|uniref:Sb-PDE family phosphodiesterase n=1 Tax=uncultured Polaribacter sp. TaxID=174711 RepID=UPI00261C8C10|nr:Sb-PDE family phosphodiesterase [uncultured Polaribacter sp.]